MRERYDRLPWWLPLLAWLPALAIAQQWPHSRLADLPFLVVPFYAAYRLWLPVARRPERAFYVAGLQSVVLWMVLIEGPGLPVRAALLASGLVLAMLAIAAPRRSARAGRDLARICLLSALFLPLLTSLGHPPSDGGATVAAEPQIAPQQPIFFIPLDLDPSGRRLALLSLRDLDSDDDESLSLWSLDVATGQPTRTYQGFPFLLADWCPAGNSLAFMAADRPWLEDESTAFGILAAPWNGSTHRVVLPVPEDGSSWLYPQWSNQQDLIAAWLTGERSAESYVVPAAGGAPRQLAVPGCRLALFGAWQADAAGAYMIPERGLFLLPAEGKPQRLVPSGEAPLDPFPMVVPDGVSPSGQHLAYLELLFKRGEIDRLDVGLKRLGGRQQSVMRNIHQLALAWSADGKLLATGSLAKQDELMLQVMEAATGRKTAFRTGLKLASRDLPIRFKFSRSGRYLAMDGQFRTAEGWDVAVVDLESRTAAVLPRATEHLLAGWTPDERLLLSSLNAVATIAPDGSDYRPIYGQGHGSESLDLLLTVAQLRGLAAERRLATAAEAAAALR